MYIALQNMISFAPSATDAYGCRGAALHCKVAGTITLKQFLALQIMWLDKADSLLNLQ